MNGSAEIFYFLMVVANIKSQPYIQQKAEVNTLVKIHPSDEKGWVSGFLLITKNGRVTLDVFSKVTKACVTTRSCLSDKGFMGR